MASCTLHDGPGSGLVIARPNGTSCNNQTIQCISNGPEINLCTAVIQPAVLLQQVAFEIKENITVLKLFCNYLFIYLFYILIMAVNIYLFCLLTFSICVL